jgi:hypothetical protein
LLIANCYLPFAEKKSPAQAGLVKNFEERREALSYLAFAFIVNCSLDLREKLGWYLFYSMIGARMLGAFLHDFLLGFAASFEITVHSNISTTDQLCHWISPFVFGRFRLLAL